MFTNIWRRKGNRAKKFGQLIAYNMRNIFLKKSYQKCAGDTIPRSFSKKSKLVKAYLWINSLTFYTVCFYCMPSWELSIYTLKQSYRPLAFTSNKALLKKKQKRGLELVSLSHFLHDVQRKIFTLLYSRTWPNFIVWLPLLLEILGHTCIVIVC